MAVSFLNLKIGEKFRASNASTPGEYVKIQPIKGGTKSCCKKTLANAVEAAYEDQIQNFNILGEKFRVFSSAQRVISPNEGPTQIIAGFPGIGKTSAAPPLPRTRITPR